MLHTVWYKSIQYLVYDQTVGHRNHIICCISYDFFATLSHTEFEIVEVLWYLYLEAGIGCWWCCLLLLCKEQLCTPKMCYFNYGQDILRFSILFRRLSVYVRMTPFQQIHFYKTWKYWNKDHMVKKIYWSRDVRILYDY